MDLLEKELEDIICESIENGFHDSLFDRGLTFIDKSFTYCRQVRMGNYGIADLIGLKKREDRTISVQIIELKAKEISEYALFQALRYARGVQEIFGNAVTKVDIYLIGTFVNPSKDFMFLNGTVSNCSFYTTKFDLHAGITFEAPQFTLVESSLDSKTVGDFVKRFKQKEVNNEKAIQ